jgi:pimeloyl-ACP methyl ester carboxylesterase
VKLQLQGKEVYAYTGGRAFDASRPCVVFLHGAQHDHSVWILQSRYLAHHGFSVLTLDLPGHGRSAGPPLASVEKLADWVLEVLSACNVSNANLVGHSMGSLIALEAAARATHGITKVALVATAFPMQVSAALLEAAANDEERAIDMINLWSHSSADGGFSHKPSNPGPGFNIVWGNKRLMQRQAKGVLLNDFTACNAYANGHAAARAVHCPVLAVLGERDVMTPPKSGSELAGLIERHRIVKLPGVGHALMSEAPDQLLDALYSFLSEP